MNAREKIFAQIQLLNELLLSFDKELCHRYGEDYTSYDIDKEQGKIVINVEFDQQRFEKDQDDQIRAFLQSRLNELDIEFDKVAQEEYDAHHPKSEEEK